MEYALAVNVLYRFDDLDHKSLDVCVVASCDASSREEMEQITTRVIVHNHIVVSVVLYDAVESDNARCAGRGHMILNFLTLVLKPACAVEGFRHDLHCVIIGVRRRRGSVFCQEDDAVRSGAQKLGDSEAPTVDGLAD